MTGKLPSTIGKYQVQSQLGRGGFGHVYKAFDPTVGRPVAIKILTLVDSPEITARFQNEATATGNLHHPNIVTIYDFGVQEGSPYLVMEYLEGQDLEQIIAGQPLSLLEKVRIMVQVGQGLQFAHEKGVIHRDIKPANIRVLPDGKVKVMDFGIARLVRDHGVRQTQAGFLIGTLQYMSPEQLEGEDADALCDIFAYGAVSYELLAGKHPFRASAPAAVMKRIRGEEPPPLSDAVPGCPSALEQVVVHALAKDRQRRYQSFGDLLLDLQPVLLELQRQRAAELVAKARVLLSAGGVVEAQAAVANILDLDPVNPEARELRERIRQEYAKAPAQLSIQAVLRSADSRIADGLFREAIEMLESAGREHPDDPELTRLLEEAQQRMRAQARSAEPASEPDRDTRKTREWIAEPTVLVPPDATDTGARPESRGTEPPRDYTAYFGQPEREPPLRAYLTILSCPDSFREGQTLPVSSSPFTIGRAQGDLSIAEDTTLSRRHAVISRTSSGFCVRDLGSPNGTYLNGRRLPPNVDEPLFLNAEIRLSSSTRLRFRCDISELPDFSGQKLANRYALERCLRVGRKSALYEGADSRPIRKVAVKLLSPTLASYHGYLDQFEREAQTAAELAHPNICRIYEYGCAPLVFSPGETKPVHYICMQMLDGGSLASRLDAPEHANAGAVASWLNVIADALNDAHRNGVVHAGLKPTSIVFSALGVPYVTDFAIAIRPQDAGRSQPILGAPEYLAPEQWDGLVATPQSDQYSLACLCYRLVAGVVPFENQLDPQTRRRNFEQGALRADVQARKYQRPPLAESLSDVLAKALSVRPDDRFPGVLDFAAAFGRSLGKQAEPGRKPRIFVSYRREVDAGWAALFADRLSTQHQLEVFIDRHRVDSARQVPEKIESAIRECDFFVCLLAKSTLESAWVREEIRLANAAGKPMIPVVHEGFRRPAAWPAGRWWRRFVPRARRLPEYARRLMDAEEVRLFSDYDEGAIEKLAKMILSTPRQPDKGS